MNRVYGTDLTIALADIVTAFDHMTVGTKVLDGYQLMQHVESTIKTFDWSTCKEPGQAYIPLPKEACICVSSGIGKRTKDPNDYVIRLHRGEVGLYLKRHIYFNSYMRAKRESSVDNVAVVVYTLEAYLKDPDITEEEQKRITSLNCSHVLVAVLASVGHPSPLTPHRFIHNLAGGNLEALRWTADEIREKAKEIKEFSSEWCVVAD